MLEREKQAQKVEEQVQERIEKEKKTYVPSTQGMDSDMSEMMRKQQEVLKNTQQILEEQKLLQEEIKGIAVDSVI